jgi:hypothetical protein
MKDRSHLNWTRGAKCFALHVGRSRKPLLHVVSDNQWPHMWRIRHRDNSVSDLLNLTRAKDAAQSHALAELGAREVGKRTAQVLPMRFSDQPVSGDSGHPAETPPRRSRTAGIAPLLVEITETAETRDEPLSNAEGWGSRAKPPPGDDWQIVDYSSEKRTRWQRRRLLRTRGRP